PAAIVPFLEVPDLRELPERARDVESFRAWGGNVLPHIAFDYVPVVQTERRFGERRQNPIVALFRRGGLKCGDNLLCNRTGIKLGSNLDAEAPCAREQCDQVDAVPGVLVIRLVRRTVSGNRLFQCLPRSRGGLVARVKENLLVSAAEQSRDLRELRVLLRQP